MALTKVTGNEIKENTITGAHLTNLSIGEADIADDAISRSKLNSVDIGKACISRLAVTGGITMSEDGPESGTGLVTIGTGGTVVPADLLFEESSGYRSTIRKDGFNLAAGRYSGVLCGQNSQVAADAGPYHIIAGGQDNEIVPGAGPSPGSHNVIGGGFQNAIGEGATLVTHSVICGGQNNKVNTPAYEASHVFVGGGRDNKASGFYSLVVGGYSNSAYFGGCVGGGTDNRAAGLNSVIAGGEDNTTLGSHAAVLGGYGNHAYGAHSVVCGGDINYVTAVGGFIGGGDTNVVDGSSDESSIMGGSNNWIATSLRSIIAGGANCGMKKSIDCFIGGGGSNWINQGNVSPENQNSAIVGGRGNQIVGGQDAWYSVIGGGHTSTITGSTHSFVGGGKSHNINTGTWGCFIGGGDANIVSSDHGVISGGRRNSILLTSGQSVISGGIDNEIDVSASAAIGGGSNNTISNGNGSGILSGDGNSLTGAVSVIAGGQFNVMAGQSNAISGGQGNEITASMHHSAIAGGYNNLIDTELVGGSAYAFIPGGVECEARNAFTSAFGYKALSWMYGQHSQASGAFASAGDGQTSVLTLGGFWDNTAEHDLMMNYEADVVLSPDYPHVTRNGVYLINVHLTAYQSDTAAKVYIAKAFRGLEKRGTTRIDRGVWAAGLTELYNASGTLHFVAITHVGDDIRIRVKNDIASNTYWLARVEITHIHFGGKQIPRKIVV